MKKNKIFGAKGMLEIKKSESEYSCKTCIWLNKHAHERFRLKDRRPDYCRVNEKIVKPDEICRGYTEN